MALLPGIAGCDQETRLQLQPVVIGSIEELDSAFAAMLSARAEVLMVQALFAGEHLGYV